MAKDLYKYLCGEIAPRANDLMFNMTFSLTFGYLIHPTVKQCIPSDGSIADVGTGTGVVLLHLARTLPSSCQFYGLDISSEQFPPFESLAGNVHFATLDAKQSSALPSEHVNRYNVVYIRFLNYGLTPDDWKLVTQTAYNMLRPGGRIHWIEGDFGQACRWVQQSTKSSHGSAYRAVGERLEALYTNTFSFHTRELPSILQDVGFSNLHQEIVSSDRNSDHRTAVTLTVVDPVCNVLKNTEQRKGVGNGAWSLEECERLHEKMMEEAKSGEAYCRYNLHLYLGQKPG